MCFYFVGCHRDAQGVACGKDTHGVFNQPTKLLSKKRRVLGASAASEEDSWKAFAEAFQQKEED